MPSEQPASGDYSEKRNATVSADAANALDKTKQQALPLKRRRGISSRKLSQISARGGGILHI